ncbi:MAG: tryptophanyl-tRNA synthetase [Candidatus Peregrinibacteria bacterium Greene0416_19]|nr:MAG: tryptophanyl-tRNA synthetase [Candidatus Peregrinibacteria bacterium Greene0416_19]
MRVLSGMQPSGALHLGNYFGSMKPNLEMSAKADESFYFVADLHALTSLQNAETLRQYRRDIVLDYLAAGFDPDRSIIFYQSDVPAHAELMWILSTVTPVGLLERAVSYKEKVEKGIAASAGLFTYPVLMAADILLYDANAVPVGKDQKQHLEMTRDIAIKFNNAYGDTFVVPEPMIREEVAVVPGTDGQKMSKSYGNTIPLFGDEKAIKKAIMGIVTDSRGPTEPKNPESNTIFQIHRLFLSQSEQKALADEYRHGISYGDAKKKLMEAYLYTFGAMRLKRAELEKKKGYVEEVMADGAAKARAVAGKTMDRVRKAVGLS